MTALARVLICVGIVGVGVACVVRGSAAPKPRNSWLNILVVGGRDVELIDSKKHVCRGGVRPRSEVPGCSFWGPGGIGRPGASRSSRCGFRLDCPESGWYRLRARGIEKWVDVEMEQWVDVPPDVVCDTSDTSRGQRGEWHEWRILLGDGDGCRTRLQRR